MVNQIDFPVIPCGRMFTVEIIHDETTFAHCSSEHLCPTCEYIAHIHDLYNAQCKSIINLHDQQAELLQKNVELLSKNEKLQLKLKVLIEQVQAELKLIARDISYTLNIHSLRIHINDLMKFLESNKNG